MKTKKVILFIIDSLHPTILERGIAQGLTPTLGFLAKNGFYHNDCVSIFPTMTPVATSSIVTGEYPDVHKVPGFIWYDHESKGFVNYGATRRAIIKMGAEHVIRNLLKNLNGVHLNPDIPTIYEKLGEYGLQSGSVNFFIYRALQKYKAKVPLLLRMASMFKVGYGEQVGGPEILTLGELIQPTLTKPRLKLPMGPFNRFGFNDIFSGKAAASIIKEDKQPDFLLVYFPDNDKYSHVHGSVNSMPAIERADRLIKGVLEQFGSLEKALEKNMILVSGDHSQSMVGLGPDNLINLDKILASFSRLVMRNRGDEQTDLAICPNERMAYIYVLKNQKTILEAVVEILSKDHRHTQIAWKEDSEHYVVLQGGSGKRLNFSKNGPLSDIYGNSWTVEGDLAVVDAKLEGQTLFFGQYPDALKRLQAALDTRDGMRVLISAAPGYEYNSEGAPIHPGGGSHGSLEMEDTHVPLIIAGGVSDILNPRITDIFPHIVSSFNLTTTKP